MCTISAFTAVLAAVAQVSVPMPAGVPMTMQTLVVPLAGIILGAKKGALCAFSYLLLGAAGLPVFSGLNGGIGAIFGPTGGFLLSFPLMAYTAGMGESRGSLFGLYAGLISGAAINYVSGMLWFSFVASLSIQAAFAACVLPFLPTAVLKILLSAFLGRHMKTSLAKGKVLLP